MKFRHKPIEIEAEQFFADVKPWPDGIWQNVQGAGEFILQTPEGNHAISSGEWVVTGLEGARFVADTGALRRLYDVVGGEWCERCETTILFPDYVTDDEAVHICRDCLDEMPKAEEPKGESS